MNEQLTKQLNDYKRSLEDRRLQTTIYTVLILVIVFFFDAYGIYSLIKLTKERHETLQKIEKLNTDLVYKKDQTELLKRKLEESQFYLDTLEKVIPTKPNVEDYMVDLVGVAAKHGFKQDKLLRRSGRDNYVELRLYLKGQKDQFVPLIKSLEERDRLSVIDSIHYAVVEETVNLELVTHIYYLER